MGGRAAGKGAAALDPVAVASDKTDFVGNSINKRSLTALVIVRRSFGRRSSW